jgi:rhamnosyltransferase
VSAPLVSIVVPTRNGAATLPAFLDALGRQRVGFRFELVVVDSSSTDGTAAIVEPRADRFVSIPAGAFNHGETRNIAIEHAQGDLIVLTVQDALPASEDWLDALTAPLRRDPALAGVFARQIPRPEATGVMRRHLERWAGASDTPRTMSVASPSEFEALPPADRLARCTFDNVCSCIRRSVWLAHPFSATPIAEDLEWARDVLLAGYRLAYVPSAVVVHSHDRSIGYEFSRTWLLHRRLYELFGLRTIPSVMALTRAIASTLPAHLRSDMTVRAAALAVAWPLGQYLGARSAVRGSAPLRARPV